MADDFPTDQLGPFSPDGLDEDTENDQEFGIELDAEPAAPAASHEGDAKDAEFGVEFEFDTEGLEPGLELDKSALAPDEPERPEPQPSIPGPGHQAANLSPGGAPPQPGPGPAQRRPGPGQQRRPRPAPPPAAGPSPTVVRALAVGAAILVVVILAVTVLGGSEEPGASGIPEQALEEGERALHQGKWIEALKAFRRLRRFPGSEEAQAARERGLEAKAIEQIMEAEPSSTTIRRLEELAKLYPDRVEVRDRLGDVRKALSSGARPPPPGEDEEEEEAAGEQ